MRPIPATSRLTGTVRVWAARSRNRTSESRDEALHLRHQTPDELFLALGAAVRLDDEDAELPSLGLALSSPYQGRKVRVGDVRDDEAHRRRTVP